MIKELYKQWCIETKRNGAVLVGGSINEFFDYFEEQKNNNTEYKLLQGKQNAPEPYVIEFDLRDEVIEFIDSVEQGLYTNLKLIQEVKLIFNRYEQVRKIQSQKYGYLIKEMLHYYDGDNCFWCGKELVLLKVSTGKEYQEHDNISTIDHILPLNKGGVDNYSNVVLSCKTCNEKKRNNFWTQRFIKSE